MKILKMNGHQISHALELRRWFSPTEWLIRRELAAGFALQQLAGLSVWDRYHAELLFQSVFLGEAVNGPEGMLSWKGARACLTRQEREQLGAMAPEGYGTTLQRLWAAAQESALPETERRQLFTVLATGYALARRDTDACPISAEEARQAFAQRAMPQTERQRWLALSGRELRLSAGRYDLLMGSGPLPAGERLRLCRVWAEDEVTLRLFRGRLDKEPVVLTVEGGDYRYFTVLGEQAVFAHPLSVSNGECVLTRTGGRLRLQTPEGERSWPCPGDLVSFAPEHDGQGWLLLTERGLDLSHYRLRGLYEEQLEGEGLIQLHMEQQLCRVLDSWGHVQCNLQGIPCPDAIYL